MFSHLTNNPFFWAIILILCLYWLAHLTCRSLIAIIRDITTPRH
jgi:hypothetical protein